MIFIILYKTYQQELMEDLLTIIHSSSMKLYTHGKKKLKEIEKIIKSEEENWISLFEDG